MFALFYNAYRYYNEDNVPFLESDLPPLLVFISLLLLMIQFIATL